MKAQFSNIRIAGVLGVVPRHASRFDDEIQNYSHSPSNSLKLKAAMGYDEHRLAEPGTTTADLAAYGLNHLIQEGKLTPNEINGLFLITQSPDYILPATSAYLHGLFGFPSETYCVDINDGCCGFIKGLFEAASYLSATCSTRALVIAGDVLSPRVSKNDRNSYPLIGDAVTITLLEKTEVTSPLDIEIKFDGKGFDKLMIPAGGARMPPGPHTAVMNTDEDGNTRSADHLVMQGRDVFNFTQTVVPEFIESFLHEHGRTKNNVDIFLLHQANAFILDRIRNKLGISRNALPDLVIRKYGNSSSGTIPMCIAGLDKITEPVRAMACGFGIGLSWGGALFELSDLQFQTTLEM